MELVEPIEVKRFFNQRAMEAFERHLYPETGFVHFDEKKPLEKTPTKISVLHTFLYVVFLYKSHQKDKMCEGERLLEKLLFFQISHKDFEGSFPKFIHEYPFPYDKKSLLYILYIFDVLINSYRSVIDKGLFFLLTESFHKLSAFLYRQQWDDSTSRILKYFLDKDFKGLLEELDRCENIETFSDLVLLAQCFNDEQRAYFYKKAVRYLHPNIGVYIGASPRSFSYFGQSEKTLFEVVLSQVFSIGNNNFFVSDHTSMMLSLIRPLGLSLSEEDCQKPKLKNHSIYYSDRYFLSSVKKSDTTFLMNRDINLFKLIVCDKSDIFSLICEEKIEMLHHQISPSVFEFIFLYPKEVPADGPNQVELNFFITAHPFLNLFIENTKATIFYLSDTIQIKSNEHVIDLKFSSEEDGRVIGQISKGNRPSHRPLHSDKYKAYDWIISFRTLHRKNDFKLKLSLTLSDSLIKCLNRKG